MGTVNFVPSYMHKKNIKIKNVENADMGEIICIQTAPKSLKDQHMTQLTSALSLSKIIGEWSAFE